MDSSCHLPDQPIEVLDACFAAQIRYVSRLVTQLYDAHLAPVGLTSPSAAVLIALVATDALSTTELAAKTGVEVSTMNRMLGLLEAQGLVQTKKGHARTRLASLTEKGKGVLNDAVPRWEAAQAEIASALVDTRTFSENVKSLRSTLAARRG